MKKRLINTVGSMFLIVALAWLPGIAYAVDGVILIDQARVFATGGFPYVINQPGSYRLAGNLTVPHLPFLGIDNSGISIRADNVTLDLNGFTITGSADYGIHGAIRAGVTVINGTVSNFNLDGITLGSRCHIENVQVLSNGHDGLNCTTGALIRGVRVAGNSTGSNQFDVFSGILVGAFSVVSNSVVANNHGFGLTVGGGLVIDNVIGFNAQGGLIGGGPGTTGLGYSRNVISSNSVQTGGPVSLGGNLCDNSPC